MTKVGIFGQETVTRISRPIQFVKIINSNGEIESTSYSPNEWNNVVLILDRTQNNERYDIMYAWDDDAQTNGRIYLGYWNDDVVGE